MYIYIHIFICIYICDAAPAAHLISGGTSDLEGAARGMALNNRRFGPSLSGLATEGKKITFQQKYSSFGKKIIETSTHREWSGRPQEN